MASSLEQARARIRSGDLPGAETILRELVASTPDAVDAIELLGASLGALGRHAEALSWLDQALRLGRASPTLLNNRALALLALGRPDDARKALEHALTQAPGLASAWTTLGRTLAVIGDMPAAEAAFRQPVRLDPSSPEAHFNLSHFLQGQGRLDEAIAGYRKVLQLDSTIATAHNNLGNALKVKGRRDEALQHFAEAARLSPNLVEAISNYGIALCERGRHTEAMPFLERALHFQPRSPVVLSNLGIAYYEIYRFADAEACQRRALELAPELDAALINLGNVLGAQGRDDEAIECYRTVLGRDPENADAYSNLGIALQERGEIQPAVSAYRKALELRPDHPDALNNLGFLLQEEGRLAEAIGYYERALAVNPHLARARYNLGLAKLCAREFVAGWELAEARFAVVPPIAVPRDFTIPRFDAEHLESTRKLAVWQEQGVGDQIVYATLLPDLRRYGISFVLETDARLVCAFRRAHPDWEIVPPEESAIAFRSCDRQVPVGSLGGILRTSAKSFDAQPRALLAADRARADAIRASLREGGTCLVGISWRSFQPQVRGSVQRRKSAPLTEFLAISQRNNIALVDLQYGNTSKEREDFAAAGGRLQRVEGLDLFNDIDGVLAAIEACDIVITTSNVTAHFAGALGKETWLLYLGGVPPFHYWATDATGRCLWYPSVRIVTGAELRTWPALFERIAQRLA